MGCVFMVTGSTQAVPSRSFLSSRLKKIGHFFVPGLAPRSARFLTGQKLWNDWCRVWSTLTEAIMKLGQVVQFLHLSSYNIANWVQLLQLTCNLLQNKKNMPHGLLYA